MNASSELDEHSKSTDFQGIDVSGIKLEEPEVDYEVPRHRKKIIRKTQAEIDRIFVCNFCEKGYGSEISKKCHMRNSHYELYKASRVATSTCKICNKPCKNGKYLQQHINTHFLLYGCSFCTASYPDKPRLDHHIKTVHSLDPTSLEYFCAHCDFSATDKIDLRDHVKSVHIATHQHVKVLKCELCLTDFTSVNSFVRHYHDHHDLLVYGFAFCDRCDYTTRSIPSMEEHMSTNHFTCRARGINSFKSELIKKCRSDQVQKQERRQKLRRNHAKAGKSRQKQSDRRSQTNLNIEELLSSGKISRVPENEPHRVFCSICTFSSLNPDDVHGHLAVHYELLMSGPVKCTQCTSTIEDYENLLVHAETHTVRMDFRCMTARCNKAFVNGPKLLSHVQQHEITKQLNYKCQQCYRRFPTAERLDSHQAICNSSSLLCPHCGVTLKAKKEFKTHVARHTNSGSYKCDFEGCGIAFTLPSRLKYHMLTHSKDKLFTCRYCSKSLKSRSCLSSHIRLKHTDQKNVEKFPCHICDISCKSKQILRAHLKRHTMPVKSTYNLSIKTFKKYDVKKLKESFDPEKDRKKFVCPICDQRFKREDHRDRHVELHSASSAIVDPHSNVFKCLMCNKEKVKIYKNETTLRAHIKNTHEERIAYDCHLCDKQYLQKANLDAHLKKHEDRVVYGN